MHASVMAAVRVLLFQFFQWKKTLAGQYIICGYWMIKLPVTIYRFLR
jgi:hypothetical protein